MVKGERLRLHRLRLVASVVGRHGDGVEAQRAVLRGPDEAGQIVPVPRGLALLLPCGSILLAFLKPQSVIPPPTTTKFYLLIIIIIIRTTCW